MPLVISVSAQDGDFDLLNWQVQGLPTGMVAEPVSVAGSTRLALPSTPGNFAAQDSNLRSFLSQPDQPDQPAQPGQYRLRITASDGNASVQREIALTVRNRNQAPRLLPLPLQLVQEGQTLAFTVRAVDADNDATALAVGFSSM